MYAVYHGPKGLTAIARRVHGLAKLLERELAKVGVAQRNEVFFDTLRLEPPAGTTPKIQQGRARRRGMNFRYRADGTINIALDETTTRRRRRSRSSKVFATGTGATPRSSIASIEGLVLDYPGDLARTLRHF